MWGKPYCVLIVLIFNRGGPKVTSFDVRSCGSKAQRVIRLVPNDWGDPKPSVLIIRANPRDESDLRDGLKLENVVSVCINVSGKMATPQLDSSLLVLVLLSSLAPVPPLEALLQPGHRRQLIPPTLCSM